MKPEVRKAIRASIKHWEEDIVRPIRESGGRAVREYFDVILNGESLPIHADSCALCQMFDCSECPLALARRSCLRVDSPYYNFFFSPTLANAEAMVEALKDLLKGE